MWGGWRGWDARRRVRPLAPLAAARRRVGGSARMWGASLVAAAPRTLVDAHAISVAVERGAVGGWEGN